MKKVFIGIGRYMIIKDNPDFASYKSKKYNIDCDIKSDIYNKRG